MALAIDQVDVQTGSNDNIVTPGIPVDAGDLIVVVSIYYNAAGTTVAVTDDLNGAHTQAVKLDSSVDANQQNTIHYFANSAAGADMAVTVNPASNPAAFITAAVLEVSGAPTTSPIASTGTNSGTGTSASVTIGSLASGDYAIIGGLVADVPGGTTPNGSQTAVHTASDPNFSVDHRLYTATTSVALSWTVPSGAWRAWAVAVKTNAAGGSSSVSPSVSPSASASVSPSVSPSSSVSPSPSPSTAALTIVGRSVLDYDI